MRLVDDDREPPISLTRDCGQMFGREFLNRRYDNPSAASQSRFQLLRRAIDGLHDPGSLRQLGYSALELAVEHDAIGDDDCRVENWLVGVVMKRNRSVRCPSDRVRLTRAGRMLDKIVLSRPLGPGVSHNPTDCI